MTLADSVLQIVIILKYRLVPYSPTHKIEFSMKFSDQFPCSLALDLFQQFLLGSEHSIWNDTCPVLHIIEMSHRFLLLAVHHAQALGLHQKDICITEHRIIVGILCIIHLRAPELRSQPWSPVVLITLEGAVCIAVDERFEHLSVVLPDNCIVPSLVLGSTRHKSLPEIRIRTERVPWCRICVDEFYLHAIVYGLLRISSTLIIWHACTGIVSCHCKSSRRIGVLNLEYGLRRILGAERDIRKRITLIQSTIHIHNLDKCIMGILPSFIPHRMLGYKDITHRRTCSLGIFRSALSHIICPSLRQSINA